MGLFGKKNREDVVEIKHLPSDKIKVAVQMEVAIETVVTEIVEVEATAGDIGLAAKRAVLEKITAEIAASGVSVGDQKLHVIKCRCQKWDATKLIS